MLRNTEGELQKSARDDTDINEIRFHKTVLWHSERKESRGNRKSRSRLGQQGHIEPHVHRTLLILSVNKMVEDSVLSFKIIETTFCTDYWLL